MKKMQLVKSSMALVLSSMLVLTACSKSGSDPTPSPSTSPSALASSVPAKTPVTFTMNTLNANLNWDNEIAAEITKRTGVSFKWDKVTTNENEKLNLWLAAGDYPELLNLRDANMLKYIEAKALIDLTDLIEKHGPNIKKAYNNDLSLLKAADGKIYGLRSNPSTKIENLADQGWLYVQAAVLKDAGYPVLKTLDDVHNMVTAYAKKNPTIGGAKTIGYSNFGGDAQIHNILDSPAIRYAGLPGTSIYHIDDNNNARIRYFEPGYTDLYKFFQKVNQEGYFDPETITQSQEQFTTKCAQGRVLVVFGPSFAGGCTTDLVKNNMPERAYVAIDIVAPGKTRVNPAVTKATLNSNDYWAVVTKNAKDPVRVIQFYDEMLKIENQVLAAWGIEGKYYTVVNGKRTITPWFKAEMDKGGDAYERLGVAYSRPLLLNIQAGGILADGDYARFGVSPSWINSSLQPSVKEALTSYKATTFADLVVKGVTKDIPFTITFFTDDVTKFNNEAIAEWKKAVAKFILEKDASKLDAIWADFEKTLKGKGLDANNKKVTELYAEYLKTLKK
ncbi:MAG: extracellular solute-binding protein [Paenibacillus sp.]|jgi:putative aldouronate transport system substrate-binding protein|nr:extracellular solute-binding protein [Paenibacillus sp.]